MLDRYPYKPNVAHDSPISSKALRAVKKTALRLLENTKGPLVEVGGPSGKGFSPIGRRKLPNGLIITNLGPEDGMTAQADVRNLPFANQSIGGILMRSLTRIPEEIARQPIPDSHSFLPPNYWPSIAKDIENNYRLIFCEDIDDADKSDYSPWSNPEIFSYSQRLALLREARRTIEPGGLLIAHSLLGTEIEIAEQLGFSMVATTAESLEDRRLTGIDGFAVMQLADLETPAGEVAVVPLA